MTSNTRAPNTDSVKAETNHRKTNYGQTKPDGELSNGYQRQRTTVKRGKGRALDDKKVAYDIIDDNLMCHVAQIKCDNTQEASKQTYPVVTPTCHWRDGNKLYWHGHAKAHNVVGSLNQTICINIARLDGLVLARSAFHHSVNYQSVTVFGQVNQVQDKAEKTRQLQKFIDKISPNRWHALRPILDKELMMTAVCWIPIDEYSIKRRATGVNDDVDDLSWPVWAGVVPIKSEFKALKRESDCVVKDTNDTPVLPSVYQSTIFGEE